MNAAGLGALGAVDGEEVAHLRQHGFEHPRLEPVARLDGVAVHRIARPDDVAALGLHRADQRGQLLSHLACAHPGIDRQPARDVAGVEPVDQPQQVVGLDRRAGLQPQGVRDPAQELDMSLADLARPVADPQQMGRGVVPFAGGGIDPGHRLFVAQQQRLVRGVEVGLADLRHGFGSKPAGCHEAQRLVEPLGHLGVALGHAVGDEIEVPAVDLVQVGIAALRERAQQVERRRGLVIGLDHAFGIGLARGGVERHVVDHVAAVARQLDAVDGLGIGRARLGELAGQPADLDHRHPAAEDQDDRHLQQHPEGVADVVGMELREALRAVAALQQEGLALGDLGKLGLQAARLAGENQRRIAAQTVLGGLQRRRIGVVRHLTDRL